MNIRAVIKSVFEDHSISEKALQVFEEMVRAFLDHVFTSITVLAYYHDVVTYTVEQLSVFTLMQFDAKIRKVLHDKGDKAVLKYKKAPTGTVEKRVSAKTRAKLVLTPFTPKSLETLGINLSRYGMDKELAQVAGENKVPNQKKMNAKDGFYIYLTAVTELLIKIVADRAATMMKEDKDKHSKRIDDKFVRQAILDIPYVARYNPA